jgi:hypothetical protein
VIGDEKVHLFLKIRGFRNFEVLIERIEDVKFEEEKF